MWVKYIAFLLHLLGFIVFLVACLQQLLTAIRSCSNWDSCTIDLRLMYLMPSLPYAFYSKFIASQCCICCSESLHFKNFTVLRTGLCCERLFLPKNNFVTKHWDWTGSFRVGAPGSEPWLRTMSAISLLCHWRNMLRPLWRAVELAWHPSYVD